MLKNCQVKVYLTLLKVSRIKKVYLTVFKHQVRTTYLIGKKRQVYGLLDAFYSSSNLVSRIRVVLFDRF